VGVEAEEVGRALSVIGSCYILRLIDDVRKGEAVLRSQRLHVVEGVLAVGRGVVRHDGIWLRHQIIHGQFMIVISLVPPSFEGTVNFSTLRWHGVGDGASGTELTTGGGSVGGSPNASAG
jgi:hypothetical protein